MKNRKDGERMSRYRFTEDELADICRFIWYVNYQEALNGDDIIDIMDALKGWNGEE